MDRIPANRLSNFDVYRFQLCCLCNRSMRLGSSLKWDGYVVHDRVWQIEANMDIDAGSAHRACLQNRIGRQLQPKDFVDCPSTRKHLGNDTAKWFGPPLGEDPDCQDFIGPLYTIKNSKPCLDMYVSAFDSPTGHQVGVRLSLEDGTTWVAF